MARSQQWYDNLSPSKRRQHPGCRNPYISTDLATAVLVKVSANAFLATKISFINAISDVCEG